MQMIASALHAAGYNVDVTSANLIDCFLDYVDAGCFSNLEYDEAQEMIENGEITIKDMCAALGKVR